MFLDENCEIEVREKNEHGEERRAWVSLGQIKAWLMQGLPPLKIKATWEEVDRE